MKLLWKPKKMAQDDTVEQHYPILEKTLKILTADIQQHFRQEFESHYDGYVSPEQVQSQRESAYSEGLEKGRASGVAEINQHVDELITNREAGLREDIETVCRVQYQNDIDNLRHQNELYKQAMTACLSAMLPLGEKKFLPFEVDTKPLNELLATVNQEILEDAGLYLRRKRPN